MTRAPAPSFDLPVERIRDGWYTDAYFNNSKRILEREGRHPRVTMQVFQKHEAVLGGIEEALAVLELCSGHRASDGSWVPGWDQLEVSALAEGDRIEPWETVMTIEGDLSLFVHLETVYLGCLARGTILRGNLQRVIEAAAGKAVLFFPARHDHWAVQAPDGWIAHAAGVAGVSTDAQASRYGGEGIGTIPHALIAAYDGDTVAAARAFARNCDPNTNVTVLVDFDNDSVGTALAVAEALGDDLWGVRLDTSGTLIDRSLADAPGPESERRGVTPELVRRVRSALDDAGHERVAIVVSGGFDASKVERFEAEGTPVDAYGVGSALRRGENDFTADVVRVDGRPRAKAGREGRPNLRLRPVR
ncbi:MAG: quinolinate phosphoribosyl transferase [Solirubrobacterales bacterium]